MNETLPTCRWRGPALPTGRFPCRSPHLVVAAAGVPAELCRACPFADRTAEAEPHRRPLPCIHLGRVLDRAGCACPLRHTRACERHGSCTLLTCQTCCDYEPDEP
jgi:hypothetical protein